MRKKQGAYRFRHCRNLSQAILRVIDENGDDCFLRLEEESDSFREVSFREFGKMAGDVALGLWSLGVQRGDRVGLVCSTRLELLVADIATVLVGGVGFVLSPSTSFRSLTQTLKSAESRVVIVDSNSIAEQVQDDRATIVVIDGDSSKKGITFGSLIERGRRVDARVLDDVVNALNPDDLWSLTYTSGSSGEPKGVLRTHANILFGYGCRMRVHEDSILLLSFSHSGGRNQFIGSLLDSATLTIPRKIEMETERLVVEQAQPRNLILAPRVFERLWNAVLDQDDNKNRLSAARDGDQQARDALRSSSLRLLGSQLTRVYTGGAPLPVHLVEACELMGVIAGHAYGAAEAGVVAYCGRVLPGVEVILAEDSEIWVRSPAVGPGYFRDEATTREVFTDDRWYKTGDLGLFEDGLLRITGRKKDLFYCIDGSNIPPERIELLLETAEFIRSSILVGDKLPYMVALIDVDASVWRGTPTREEVAEAVWRHVNNVNRDLEAHEQIRSVAIAMEPFPTTVKTTVSMGKRKIDRRAVEQLLVTPIRALYASPPQKTLHIDGW